MMPIGELTEKCRIYWVYVRSWINHSPMSQKLLFARYFGNLPHSEAENSLRIIDVIALKDRIREYGKAYVIAEESYFEAMKDFLMTIRHGGIGLRIDLIGRRNELGVLRIKADRAFDAFLEACALPSKNGYPDISSRASEYLPRLPKG